jgi:hypothetical protein
MNKYCRVRITDVNTGEKADQIVRVCAGVAADGNDSQGNPIPTGPNVGGAPNDDANKRPTVDIAAPTYDTNTVAGAVIQTWTSAFPAPANWALSYKQPTGSTPGTRDQLHAALEIVKISATQAEVRWTGNISASEELDFDYAVSVRDENSCYSGVGSSTLTYFGVPEIPEYVCGGASQGVSHSGRLFLGAVESSSNQWSAIKAKLDDSNYTPVNIGGIGLVGMKNLSSGTSTQMLISHRTYDFSSIAEPLFMRCSFTCNQLNREFVILWTTDPEPAVNNKGYDRASWNLLGTVKNDSATNQTKDVDLAAIGKPSYVRIIVTTINDYLNDSINGTILDDDYYELSSEEVRRCL